MSRDLRSLSREELIELVEVGHDLRAKLDRVPPFPYGEIEAYDTVMARVLGRQNFAPAARGFQDYGEQ